MVHAIVSVFMQRGHWFPNEGDIEGFRANLKRACPRDESVVRLKQWVLYSTKASALISRTMLKPCDMQVITRRADVRSLFVISQLKTTAKRKTYKMVLYQRDLSRKLADQDSAVAQLQEALGADWDIEVGSCCAVIYVYLLLSCVPWSV
jgi:hypothetical protein